MRNFILPSLSTNAIAAANNAAMPAKVSAADKNAAADGSPFGLMLAATAGPDAKPKAAPAPDDANRAAKPSNDKNKDAFGPQAQTATKTNSQSANNQPVNHKPVDRPSDKSADTKAADSKSSPNAEKGTDTKNTDDKSADAANDNNNDGAQQPTQVAAPLPPPQTPVQPAQPDGSALAMAQAQAALTGGQPPLAANAANDPSDTNSDTASGPDAIGAKTAKGQSPAGAGANVPQAGMPADAQDVADAADGIAPQVPGVTAGGNAKNPLTATQASSKNTSGDAKQANTPDDTKAASQPANAGSQPTPPAPAIAQASSPAAPTTNMAAPPAVSQALPVTGTNSLTASQTVQVTAQTADTAHTASTLAVAIAAKTQSGARQFDIRLDPPELGHVEVRLSIDASGKTEAHMTADQPETLNLLQKDSSSLTQALRDAGLDVSQNGLNFSLRGQNGQADNGAGRGPRSNLAASRVLDAAQGATSSIQFTGSAADGRLDIHV